MDFQATLLDPIYTLQGVPAVLTLAGAPSSVDITVIDKTGGIDTGLDVNVQTLVPAAAVRVVELTSLGVAVTSLPKAHIEFNESRWLVKSYRPKPTLKGERDGEVYLLLEELDFIEEDSESESESGT